MISGAHAGHCYESWITVSLLMTQQMISGTGVLHTLLLLLTG